jgi:hypothetical protein
MMAETRVG